MIYNKHWLATLTGFPGGASGKNLLANAGNSRDTGSILGWEDPLEERAW